MSTLLEEAQAAALLEQFHAREGYLRRQLALTAFEALTATCVGVTDWQVRQAQFLASGRSRVWWPVALQLARQMPEPAPAPARPLWEQVLHAPLASVSVLRQALSHYWLIRYLGHPAQQQKPIVGVLLVHPAQARSLLRFSLVQSKILPRSKHWRRLLAYFSALETALQQGQSVTEALASPSLQHQRLVSFSQPYTVLGDPDTVLQQLYEEYVMSKHSPESAGDLSDMRREESRSASPASTRRLPTFCTLLAHLAPRMTYGEVLETMQALMNDGPAWERVVLALALAHRAIRLLRVGEPALDAEQVEQMLLALEQLQATFLAATW